MEDPLSNFIPEPVFDEDPGLVDFYRKAWAHVASLLVEDPALPQSRHMDAAPVSGSAAGTASSAKAGTAQSPATAREEARRVDFM